MLTLFCTVLRIFIGIFKSKISYVRKLLNKTETITRASNREGRIFVFHLPANGFNQYSNY